MKKGLCVGTNYVGTEYELRGCVNDADDWAQLLGRHGYDVALLAERQATKDQIVGGVERLVTALKPGDVGFVTYSGHGTWLPDTSGDEPDGRDEALCPVDMGDDGHNLIVDDELHALFAELAPGAHVVFVTDSCHSGTVFRFVPVGGRQAAWRRPRFIPPSHFLKADVLVRRMERAYGRPAPSDAPLPGIVHLSGCRDTEYANDAEIDGRACGAMSYYATRAFEAAARAGGTYADAYRALRRHLPSVDYPQTPLLNAPSALKRARVFV